VCSKNGILGETTPKPPGGKSDLTSVQENARSYLNRHQKRRGFNSHVGFWVTLSQASVDFFKAEAKKHHTSYQAMIRQLLVSTQPTALLSD